MASETQCVNTVDFRTNIEYTLTKCLRCCKYASVSYVALFSVVNVHYD